MANSLVTICERMWRQTVIAETGCWVWTGRRDREGYGVYRIQRQLKQRELRFHRVSYEMLRGPIPDGLVIDHLCRNHACINPAHMECVTRRENSLRGMGPAAINARKTACPQGHPYDEENTYVWQDNRRPSRPRARICRKCRQATEARYRSNSSGVR